MLNERIRQLREAKNLTQVQLAAKLSVTKQSVSNWENNYICLLYTSDAADDQ